MSQQPEVITTIPPTPRGLIGLLTRPAPPALVGGALLLLRLALATIFFAHGWQSLYQDGIAGIVAAERELGIPLAELAAPFTVYLELVGAPLLALGLLARPIAAAFTALMVGAFAFVHVSHGLFVENGGFELVLVLGVATLLITVSGAGQFSLDHWALAKWKRR